MFFCNDLMNFCLLSPWHFIVLLLFWIVANCLLSSWFHYCWYYRMLPIFIYWSYNQQTYWTFLLLLRFCWFSLVFYINNHNTCKWQFISSHPILIFLVFFPILLHWPEPPMLWRTLILKQVLYKFFQVKR